MRARGQIISSSVLFAASLIAALPVPARTAEGTVPSATFVAAPAEASVALQAWQTAALRALAVVVGAQAGAGIVNVTVDRAELFTLLPELRAHGVLPGASDTEDAEERPFLTANTASLLLTSWAVRRTYDADPRLNATRWRVSLSYKADNGTHVTTEMFAFTLDRASYARTDWARLSVTEFPKAVKGFSYNLRFTLQMSREIGGGINDD